MVSRLNILAPMVMAVALAGSASAQCEVVKLLPTPTVEGDEFGCAVALEGEWAIIGAHLNDDRAFQSGAAFVFHRTNGVWTQTQQLMASDGQHSDQFGLTVAISGNVAVIGAPAAASTLGPFTRTGVAYVFELVGDQWRERAKLVASDPSQQALFASAVAISGQSIVIGAWAASPVGLHSGVAYVFEGMGSSWNQVARLLPFDLGPGDVFGWSVAIDGDSLMVGADSHAISASSRPGAVYSFERSTQGAWIQQQKLLASVPTNQAYFGISVAISGDTALIGKTGGGAQFSALYAFDRIGGIWTETQLIPSTFSQGIGGKVEMDANVALVWTPDNDAGSTAGAVFAYRRSAGIWQRIAKILANDGSASAAFGASFALDGRTVLIGAPGDDGVCPANIMCNSGSAYIIELAPTAAQYGHCTTGSPCVSTDWHGGCGNATGQGAILQACGSGSVAADDLRFEVRHLTPGTSALLFMGGAQTNVLFGNGRRVVAGGSTGIFRLGIQAADTSGVIHKGPGLIAQSHGLAPAGHITVGQTWNLQCWYRDMAGPCGAAFNLSNGLEVTFVP